MTGTYGTLVTCVTPESPADRSGLWFSVVTESVNERVPVEGSERYRGMVRIVIT